MFYEVNQNNSGGYFVVNDYLCHRLFIEADSYADAKLKAEEFGCYWNGVTENIDCPCCGDRWFSIDEVDLEELKEYFILDHTSKKSWWKKVGSYRVIEPPKLKTGPGFKYYCGKVSFSTIEEYAQYLANNFAWTIPDCRIFYKDGTIKEIYQGGVNNEKTEKTDRS